MRVESFLPIPRYLDAPVTFVCRVHGPMLLAFDGGTAWLYRVHGNHWCSLRKATPDDLRQIAGAVLLAHVGAA